MKPPGPHDYYFAYGSNMNAVRMQERQMDYDQVDGGVLHGFRLAFNKRSTKQIGMASANVVPSPGFSVEGVAYRLLDGDVIKKWILLKDIRCAMIAESFSFSSMAAVLSPPGYT